MSELLSHPSSWQLPAASLAPRLQQAVRWLRLSSQELAQLVGQAIGSNPFLDLEPSLPGPPGAIGAAPVVGAISPARGPRVDMAADPQTPWPDASQPGAWPEPPGQGDPFDSIEGVVTLAENLSSQLACLRLSTRDRALCQALVHCLDDDGYLRMPLLQAARSAGCQGTVAAAEARLALRRVQSLEPCGVGARDLEECLLLQLRVHQDAGADRRLVDLARRLVRLPLGELATGNPVHLARGLRAPVVAVAHALGLVQRLDPHPGWRVGGAAVPARVPELLARRHEGRWQVLLLPDGVPSVQVNEAYAQALAQSGGAARPALAMQLQEARFLARQVRRRRATILAIARIIVARQERFLTLGALALRPLALGEIARALGMHESTVSRATCGKFIDTPAGVFELRSFFSRGMPTARGMDCSPAAIRTLVGEMIGAEPAAAPLSDVALARALADQGLPVARRTVTKYRQQLRLAPAAHRRQTDPGVPPPP